MWSLAVAGILGLLILLTGLAVVFLKNPVYAALAFLANLCLTAILYLAVLSAPFIAIVQVIVYMGAILVFILFVIMLMDLKKEDITERFFSPRLIFALVVVVVFLAQMLLINVPQSVQLAHYVHAKDIAQIIFTKYALLFELVSVLIFAAAVGAVALAKKRM
jgi:NADH-quinone oxidoreductase subunit J